jgi:hypothetical protein
VDRVDRYIIDLSLCRVHRAGVNIGQHRLLCTSLWERHINFTTACVVCNGRKLFLLGLGFGGEMSVSLYRKNNRHAFQSNQKKT